MTKDEALKLALEALERCVATCFDPYAHEQAMSGSEHFVNQTITAIKEALAQTEPNYKKALEAWLDKTEWVQETVKPHELGMHRADVLNQRIEEALAQPEQPKVRTGNCLRVGVCASEGHKIAPQRTWVGLTDEEIQYAFKTNSVMVDNGNAYMVAGLRAVNIAKAIEAKLRSKNT
jgi:hypothetical protein